jgi:hypothetical protein
MAVSDRIAAVFASFRKREVVAVVGTVDFEKPTNFSQCLMLGGKRPDQVAGIRVPQFIPFAHTFSLLDARGQCGERTGEVLEVRPRE